MCETELTTHLRFLRRNLVCSTCESPVYYGAASYHCAMGGSCRPGLGTRKPRRLLLFVPGMRPRRDVCGWAGARFLRGRAHTHDVSTPRVLLPLFCCRHFVAIVSSPSFRPRCFVIVISSSSRWHFDLRGIMARCPPPKKGNERINTGRPPQ
jgi:hypothetical protein